MAKYRVKDSVGEIHHGIGKEVHTYRAGEAFELSAADAKPISHLLDRVPDDLEDDEEKDDEKKKKKEK